jgi:hypothetical protein
VHFAGEIVDQNPYAPPVAVVSDVVDINERDRFYVVGARKFFLLYFLTLGLYRFYWSYKHWANLRARSGEPMWPVARAIFAIFFMHSLTEEIDHTLKRANVHHAWDPRGLATTWVVMAVASSICDRLAGKEIGSPITDLVAIVLLVPMGLAVWRIQDAANRACGQPDGASNRQFTGLNWFWMVLGGLWWVIVVVGLALIFGVIPS